MLDLSCLSGPQEEKTHLQDDRSVDVNSITENVIDRSEYEDNRLRYDY